MSLLAVLGSSAQQSRSLSRKSRGLSRQAALDPAGPSHPHGAVTSSQV